MTTTTAAATAPAAAATAPTAQPTSSSATKPPPQTAGATAVLELLERAEASLLAACHSREVDQRHQHARLGALRAAAALVVARSTGSASGPRSLWAVLPVVAPELGEWAGFFAAATRRTGTPGIPSTREADDLLRQAETFLDLVRAGLGLPASRHHDLLLPAAMPTSMPTSIPMSMPASASP
jgi:hypothetical protein